MNPPRPGRRQRRLGQNFLADPNLLDLIVRESRAGPEEVVLEVGGGAGALTERLAPVVKHLHVVETDRHLIEGLNDLAARLGNVTIHHADALKADLAGLDPVPVRMVSNLPYSIATPLLITTVIGMPAISEWLVMVQLEIAERLAAAPGSRLYGSPTAVLGVGCEVQLVRKVDPAVFTPRPRVGSALVRVRRTGPPPSPDLHSLIRDAFAHRRKSLPRSLELARPGSLAAARAALEECGLDPRSRAEVLSSADFQRLADGLRRSAP